MAPAAAFPESFEGAAPRGAARRMGADQPQNAQSIAAIGAGLALPKPDAEALRAAIQRVLDEPGFRGAARAIAAEMTTLPRVDEAVDALLTFGAS